MAMDRISNLNTKSMLGSCYFGFFKACFFAGLFCRAKIVPLSGL